MFYIDIPEQAPQEGPVVVARLNQAAANTQKERIMGICHISPNGKLHELSAENVFGPVDNAIEYFKRYESIKVSAPAKITVLENIKHGSLIDGEDGNYIYKPAEGYIGRDKATLLVEISGHKAKIVYFFQVVDGVAIGNDTYKNLCGVNEHWKISAITYPFDVVMLASPLLVTAGLVIN